MKLAAAYLALTALITGAVLVVADGADESRAPRLGDVRLASLETFDDCAEVEEWFADMPGPEQLSAGGVAEDSAASATAGAPAGGGSVGRASGAAPAAQEAAAPGADGDQGYSGTNLQERDVDEPDVVKTNGEVIVAATYGKVRIVDAARRAELATVDLDEEQGGSAELLLNDDRLLIIERGFRMNEQPRPMPIEPGPAAGGSGSASGMAVDIAPAGEEITRLATVDISDPSRPDVLSRAELDGGYVSARLVGDTARIVLRATPHLGGDVRRLEAASILPAIAVDGAEPEPLTPCDVVTHPAAPSGPGTTSVVTFDVTADLEPLDSDTIVADAATVYASTDRLYVATQRWDDVRAATELHAFDTEDPGETIYVGSGLAEGWLLNQFSLSERGGILRVATTIQDPRSGSGSESVLTTFEEAPGGELRQVGRLDGLGPDEQIYAVRFIEDIAFVVTFRQTDPLYAIDVSDPTAPEVLGELKIPGFSAYLHPIDGDRLLGVGQDATDEGRRLGTQVSLFDVGDLAAPERIDNLSVRGASSPVEYDHKAFLWWPGDDVAVVPIERYDTAAPTTAALVIGVTAADLDQRGTVTHDEAGRQPAMIVRSLVIGDVLWTMSEAGLLASDLASLEDIDWVPFPQPERFEIQPAIEG